MIIYAEGTANNGRTIENNGSLFCLDHRGSQIGFFLKGSEGGHLAGLQLVIEGAACTWLLGYLFVIAILCLFAEGIKLSPHSR